MQGSGRAMVLGNFQCRFVRLTWIIVRLGPTVLAVGAGVLFGFFFSPIISLFFLFNSGRLSNIDRNSHKGPFNHKQLTILFYPIILEGHRGTTDEFGTMPFHLVLFSAAPVEPVGWLVVLGLTAL